MFRATREYLTTHSCAQAHSALLTHSETVQTSESRLLPTWQWVLSLSLTNLRLPEREEHDREAARGRNDNAVQLLPPGKHTALATNHTAAEQSRTLRLGGGWAGKGPRRESRLNQTAESSVCRSGCRFSAVQPRQEECGKQPCLLRPVPASVPYPHGSRSNGRGQFQPQLTLHLILAHSFILCF